jgi:hypothetical protein
MRMGFNWKPAIARRIADNEIKAACPQCGEFIADEEGYFYRYSTYAELFADKRRQCAHCGSPLWSNIRRSQTKALTKSQLVEKAMCQIPTIGPKTAARLINAFGVHFIENMLSDNVYEFINLMDKDGELVFSDKQATRMELAMANMEFGLGQGHYQLSEYIKRYLPNGYFGSMLIDEAHEYKNQGTAQGQAIGVLASKAKKVILLTGTLMGGYADDCVPRRQEDLTWFS